MSVVIFLLGVFVTVITLSAVILVGLSEAADPGQSRPEDLTSWERYLVGRERAKRASEEE
jgi:hypothetical protein